MKPDGLKRRGEKQCRVETGSETIFLDGARPAHLLSPALEARRRLSIMQRHAGNGRIDRGAEQIDALRVSRLIAIQPTRMSTRQQPLRRSAKDNGI